MIRRILLALAVVATTLAAPGSPAAAAPTGWMMSPGHSGLCLQPAGGSTATGVAIEQAWCEPTSTAQRWIFLTTTGGHNRLKNGRSGKCMNVYNNANANGTKIIQYPCTTSADNDQFRPQLRYTSNGADYYNLIAKHSFKCLNVPNNSTASGTDLIQWPCTTTARNDTFTWVAGAVIIP